MDVAVHAYKYYPAVFFNGVGACLHKRCVPNVKVEITRRFFQIFLIQVAVDHLVLLCHVHLPDPASEVK